MGQTTSIAWCDHTFNPWRGCIKVSPGCLHCYAETQSRRNPAVLGSWGPAPRVLAAESYWRQPIGWNAATLVAEMQIAPKVFCGSLMDWAEDRPDLDGPRTRLWDLMRKTPFLDWLLLTKRHVEAEQLSYDMGFLPNIWMGMTTENQERFDTRTMNLGRMNAAIRFLSIEPLLEPINLRSGILHGCNKPIDWIIIGGESGPGARPCHVEWIDDLVRQCRQARIPVFIKQLGSNARCDDCILGPDIPLTLKDPKGGDPSEWPRDLRIRQFPNARILV